MPFQTPDSELLCHVHDVRSSRSRVGFGLDRLISKSLADAPFELSLTNPVTNISASRHRLAANVLRETLVLNGCLGRPSDPVLISRREEAEYFVEEIEFTATPPLRVPATVVIPKNSHNIHPAVVALHSMGSLRVFGREKLLAFANEPEYLTAYRSENYGSQSWQVELARRGYLSIAIDAFNFGLRTERACADRQTFCRDRIAFSAQQALDFTIQAAIQEEPVAERSLATVGLSVAALIATDDLRTVDYLCSRSDVDTSCIGCAGLSFGSFRTNYLSALDDRIRAAVSVCWISTLDGIVDYNIPGAMGFFALPPRLYRHLDLPDIIALSAPKPFLAISGWRDILMQPAGVARAHLRLREYWKSLGAPEAFGSLVYDTGHEFNATMQKEALSFLDLHLGSPCH